MTEIAYCPHCPEKDETSWMLDPDNWRNDSLLGICKRCDRSYEITFDDSQGIFVFAEEANRDS